MGGKTASERSFVGRADAVEALERQLGELRAGIGGVTLVVGGTGVGKSTLISQFVSNVRARGIRVLIGRAAPLDEPPPFSLLRSAIDSASEDPLLRADDDPQLGGGGTLIGFAPGFGEESFAPPVGIEARLIEVLGRAGGPRAATPDQVLTGIAERFLEYTRHGPTMLVLEDLGRADRSSLAAVEFFAKELEHRPLWIVATTRPSESLSAAGRLKVETFESATRPTRVVLRPLDRSETADFLRLTVPARDLDPAEVERRYSESGGNPYLLEQFEHRAPSDGETGAWTPTTLPRTDEVEREILDIASVLGPEFPFALLLGASDEPEEKLAEEVDRLVGRGLLFERPGELLEFPEDRLREEVYNYLSERRRRQLHRRAARTLEGMGLAGPPRIYALARHFYLGREGSKSEQYNRIAAEIDERALAPEAAWDHFSRALESHRESAPDDLDGEAELVLGLARITEELGVLKEAETILRDFFDRENGDLRLSPGRRAALEIFLARVLTDRGDLPAAGALAQKVLDSPGLDDQRLVRVGAHHQLGQVAYYEGRYAEALAHHTEEIELARQVGNALVLLRAQIWRVAALAMIGDTRQAIAEAREVTAARDRLGSVRESAQAHLFLGDILADARSPPDDRRDALGEFAKAIEFAEVAKDPRRIGWALYKTAELLREAGRLEEASASAQRASGILEQVGDHVGLSVAFKVRGQIAMDQGQYDRAESELQEALRGLRGTNHTLEEIDVLLRLGQLALARGDTPGAQGYVRELEALKLAHARPDLVEEFEALRAGRPSGGGAGRGI
jgi:tetratricopeptide (TPR) repeat protein